jgi:membrane-bound metal-dependent hydrolase YbcI (DUF457 family)
MIGLTTNDLLDRGSFFADWRTALFIAVLSNLPDLDIAAGLLIQGNGYAFHRGPTHSVAFALFAGALAANAWRLWSGIPRMKWTSCFLVILSHVIGDLLFTKSPVSFLWPLEVHWSAGFSGWAEALSPIFFEAYRDAGIVLVCVLITILARLAMPLRSTLRSLGEASGLQRKVAKVAKVFLLLWPNRERRSDLKVDPLGDRVGLGSRR